ncbi:MAG: uroporphyrinogen decarboxylase [Anaerolineae bacterium]|nr:uroporphyrinogen decarboxylase [Anaerolineae bacterium]
MSNKENLFAVFRHEQSEAVPWVPFAGVHAGKLKGYSGREMLTDAEKLYESLLEVHRVYDPDGMPVTFDLQIEAEILGCDLVWADEAPPSVVSHPLGETLSIPGAIPQPTDGRLPLVLDVMRRMKTAVGQDTALYGLVTGPFTLASHLRGTDIFMDTFDHPEFLHELMAYTTRVAIAVADHYIDAGMDVIALVDPVVSQVSPRMFNKYLSGPFKSLFDHIRARGVFSSFFVCGDATKNIKVMCETGPDCISIDENIDMVSAKQITDSYNVAIAGNIPLSSTMLLGTQQDNMKFVVDLLGKVDHHNFILSPGCDMPYDTPVENTIGAMQAVRETEAIRQLVANYTSPLDDIDVELPDYDNLERPLLEVFTIDSATCAACGYMTAVAKQVVEGMDGKVDWVERNSMNRENLARLKKMGLSHLPEIYINGKLAYSSNIPSAGELRAALEKLL